MANELCGVGDDAQAAVDKNRTRRKPANVTSPVNFSLEDPNTVISTSKQLAGFNGYMARNSTGRHNSRSTMLFQS